MGGHVEEEEVSFFGSEDSFVDETFGETFSDLFELVADFHDVPGFAWREERASEVERESAEGRKARRESDEGRVELAWKEKLELTTQQIHPSRGPILLTPLHHLERLIQDGFSRLPVVDNLDESISQSESPTRWIFDDRDPTTKSELNEDAASEGVRDVV